MSRLVIVLLMVINSALACAQFLIFPPNDTICLGEGLQLSASTSCQGTALYTWYVNGDSILSNGSGTFSLIPTQASNQLMVICRCNVNGSIQVDTAQTSLTVSSPSIDAGPDQYVDSGTVVTLQASGLLDSVLWSPSFEVNYPTLFSVQTTPSATTTYMVQGFYAGCECSPEMIANAIQAQQKQEVEDQVGQIRNILNAFKQNGSHYVTACEFAPHGKILVSASCDKTLKLWDVESGTCQATLEGHRYLF